MPILTATREQILAITGVNAATLRSDRMRGHAVASLGLDRPLLDSHWLLIDGIAMLIRDDLAQAMPRRGAAMITRAFFDQWLTAVARIEHRDEAILFSAAELMSGAWWAAAGPAEQLPSFIASQPPLRRLAVCNVAAILDDMVKRARKVGFDLRAGSFWLPPDHPLHVQWTGEIAAWRAKALKRFDPLHAKPPPDLTPAQRKQIVGALWSQ